MAFTADITVNPPHSTIVEFDDVWGGRRPLTQCVPIDPTRTWLPSSGFLEKPRKKRVPDVIGRWEVILVSSRFKELLESLSLHTQQFFPFALRNGPKPDADVLEYYVLNVTLMIDCIVQRPPGRVVAQTGEELEVTQRSSGRAGFAGANEVRAYAFVLDKKKIKPGMHIWREPERSRLFLSNELVRQVEQSPKITGFDGCECLEVD